MKISKFLLEGITKSLQVKTKLQFSILYDDDDQDHKTPIGFCISANNKESKVHVEIWLNINEIRIFTNNINIKSSGHHQIYVSWKAR